MLGEAIAQNNLFIGLKQGSRLVGLDLKPGPKPTTRSANPLTSISLDWIGHYGHDEQHLDTYGCNGSGRQLTLSATPNDDMAYILGLNYRF